MSFLEKKNDSCYRNIDFSNCLSFFRREFFDLEFSKCPKHKPVQRISAIFKHVSNLFQYLNGSHFENCRSLFLGFFCIPTQAKAISTESHAKMRNILPPSRSLIKNRGYDFGTGGSSDAETESTVTSRHMTPSSSFTRHDRPKVLTLIFFFSFS